MSILQLRETPSTTASDRYPRAWIDRLLRAVDEPLPPRPSLPLAQRPAVPSGPTC